MPASQHRSLTLRDCVYGQAVGDALGVPYEFLSRGTFECKGMVGHGSHDQPAGTWSDDTSMALATCDSIRATGRVDVRDMRERFVRWYREGAYTVSGLFDIGGTTADALSSGRGRAGERDNGNGSLMRILPLAFTGATDDEVRAVSAITHAHATSCEACVRMVHVARRLIAGVLLVIGCAQIRAQRFLKLVSQVLRHKPVLRLVVRSPQELPFGGQILIRRFFRIKTVFQVDVYFFSARP